MTRWLYLVRCTVGKRTFHPEIRTRIFHGIESDVFLIIRPIERQELRC